MTTDIGGTWRVFVSWQGIPDRTLGLYAGPETCTEHPSWLDARKYALHTSCLNGTRYISVQRPDDVVAAEYDRITNRWRQYPLVLVDVDHTTEITDEGASAAAWCTCGWSRFVFYDRRVVGAADAAAVRAEGMAGRHRADPAGADPSPAAVHL